MQPSSIPKLTRGTDPSIPKQVLESKVKRIDKRRAEIESLLASYKDDDYFAQELRAEYAALGNMRSDIDAQLNPRPKQRRSPELAKAYYEQRERDLAFLRTAIKEQTEQTEWHAQKRKRRVITAKPEFCV